MRLLLDTHALLWYCEGSSLLSELARLAIEDARDVRFVSHATLWEVAIKLTPGKLRLTRPYDEIFPGVITANGWHILPSQPAHYAELLRLQDHHRDPFDRLMLAQARVEGSRSSPVIASSRHTSSRCSGRTAESAAGPALTPTRCTSPSRRVSHRRAALRLHRRGRRGCRWCAGWWRAGLR
jgi:PIN domain nuclease of toxin-antitoxin system